VELRGLRFAHSNTGAIPAMMGIVTIEGNGWLVTRCTFTHGDFAGLSVAGNGHRIVENVASNNGNSGINLSGTDAAHGWVPYDGRPPQDVVFEGNETSHNNYRKFDIYWHAGGMKLTACNDVRVARHTAIGNRGTGIWFDLYCRNVVIERSLAVGNASGIVYEISDQARIEGNLVTGSSEHGIYVQASSDVLVANNTLDDNGAGIVVHGLPREEHGTRNNRVRDNVIGFSRGVDLVLVVGLPNHGNTSDHNLFASQDRSVKIALAKDWSHRVTHTDLAAVVRESGGERTSRIGDPRWVDRARGDYRLRDDSPARRAVRVAAAALAAPSAEPAPRHMGAWEDRVLASPQLKALRRSSRSSP
jgi:parallel beta-helix repeat protein